MKKKYNSPKLILIGDMVNNTLGSSGGGTDNGTFQDGQANGGQATNNNTGFNSSWDANQ